MTATFYPAFDDPDAPLIDGKTPKCGNRRDLPKKERRHSWADMGPDIRHLGDGTLAEVLVRACATCGTDEYSVSGTFGKKPHASHARGSLTGRQIGGTTMEIGAKVTSYLFEGTGTVEDIRVEQGVTRIIVRVPELGGVATVSGTAAFSPDDLTVKGLEDSEE